MDDLAASPGGEAQKQLLSVPRVFYGLHQGTPVTTRLRGLTFLPKLHGAYQESTSHRAMLACLP